MKKFLKISWWLLCGIAILFYLIACSTTYLPASQFSYSIYFVLGFPYFFIAAFAVILINIFLKRKRIWLLLFLLPAYKNLRLTFAFHPHAWQMTKDTSALRIMTWNVAGFADSTKYANNIVQKIFETIATYNPGVVCMQQHFDGAALRNGNYISVIKIMDSLGYRYHLSIYDTYMVGGKEEMHGGSGSAIYSKYPINNSGNQAIVATFENISNHQDYMEKVGFIDIQWQNKPLRIYTARWQSFYLNILADNSEKQIVKQLYNSIQYIDEAFPSIEKTHQKEAEIIRREMNKSPYPFIYCGDMNGLPISYNCEYLKGNNLQDAFVKGGWGIGTTYYKIAPMLRIDACLVDKIFKVQQTIVPQRKLSDHYPVVSDITWR